MPAAGLVLALCALLQLCPAALGALRPQLLVERSGSRRLSKVGGFSWENCGEGKDPVVLQSLSVAPDPISIPGNLRISAAVNGNKAMASPLKPCSAYLTAARPGCSILGRALASLHFLGTLWDETEQTVLVVEKALGDLWIQLPCIDQLGSCTYDDICTILDTLIPPGTPCPEPLLTYGIPCHCPFKAGSYSLPASDFALPDVELPSFMTNGNYRVRAVVSSKGEELACVKLGFSLQSQ
uniref:GM2 ganglioside activator n=1 Tax=Cairina moschata TaxID=8855 RepID=A0A8C3BV38_CAIMO